MSIFQGQLGVLGPEGEGGMQGAMGQPGQKVIQSPSIQTYTTTLTAWSLHGQGKTCSDQIKTEITI